jgi:hypothetical protein
MTDPVEDLVGEAEITIRDAYRRGVENAKSSIDKIPQTRRILSDFEEYLVGFKMYKNLDGIRYYEIEGKLLNINEITKLFLLRYGYEEE